ncbi:hypothetical protein Tco_0745241 [Tanacetum coccineum]
MVSLLVSKVDRLECAYTVYPILPAIPNQSRIIWEVAARAEGNGNGNNENQVRCYNYRGMGHLARNYIVRPRRRDAAYIQTQLLIAQKEEAEIQLQAEEFDLMVAARYLDEIEEVNANCILMANLQQALTSGTQTDKAPVYDSDGSAELLEPISEPHQVQQNDSNVISAVSSMEQSGGTVEQNPAIIEETRAYFESLYNNLAVESVYQEQCLTKKINALHLSSAKSIMTLNEEIANLNNQLSKEKSTVSYLQQEKKKLKSDFKIREDEILDKQIQLENKIKELDNILHDPPAVYDSEETLQLAQESRLKIKQLNKEIKPANSAKINQLSKVFVSQKAKSREELCDDCQVQANNH